MRHNHQLEPDPLWYKDAIIYQLHVKSFFDSNNDGVGDFPGLISKLDYLCDLGVNAVWLLPFYPSPRRDDGYDISDYKGVHPEYGTLSDFKKFIEEAHARKIRVITELVLNHTSDQHPWFQRARMSKPGSAARNFYVWSNSDKAYSGTRIIFLDVEKSNWAWDDVAKAYYWHRFYSHQPDLNYDNPRVYSAVSAVLRFWLDIGVDGLRLDAVPYLVEREGTNNENLPETHAILKRLRAEVEARYRDRMLLAEANQWPEDVQAYFGEGDECHMLFHFPLMPRMYMAIAQEDRFPITDIMRQTPDIPPECQWAVFLRNHDELTLEMVTDRERDYLWEFYAADRRARLNLGIRRRLAPLLENDRRRIELMNNLLLTMPGTPIVYYGDEIGMGDNLHLGDRDGVRTPMQWSPDRNGGFSRADPAGLILPVIMDPIYGYEAVNVEAQLRNPHSLLHWMKRMLLVRNRQKAFGRGGLRFLRPRNRKVLAYLREYEGDSILCVVNLARTAQAVELELQEFAGRIPVELLGGTAFPAVGQLPYLLTLPPYGFYWFSLSASAEPPPWSILGGAIEHHTLVLRDGLADVLQGRDRHVLEQDILPHYIAQRHWYRHKGSAISKTEIIRATGFPAEPDLMLIHVAVSCAAGEAVYAMPLVVTWDDKSLSPFEEPLALARVRKRSRMGYLTDALANPEFLNRVLHRLRENARITVAGGELAFASEAGAEIPEAAHSGAEWLDRDLANSLAAVGGKAILKLLRVPEIGTHPEPEMLKFLKDAGFAAVPRLLGTVTERGDNGEALLLIAEQFIPNQGDAFSWTTDQIRRLAGEWMATGGNGQAGFGAYENFVQHLGARLGEMHALLARATADEAFAPEKVTGAEAAEWVSAAEACVREAFEIIGKSNSSENSGANFAHDAETIAETLGRVLRKCEGLPKFRIHGDFHLGQVLVAAGDVVFIDFEGNVRKPLQQRRRKASPLRDVAGILRSFDGAIQLAGDEEGALEGPAAAQRAAMYLAELHRRASEAFLQGYGTGRGAPLARLEQDLVVAFALEQSALSLCDAKRQGKRLALPVRAFAAAVERLRRAEP